MNKKELRSIPLIVAQNNSQKYYALFATQGGNEHGGNFAFSRKDNDRNIKFGLPWHTPHSEDMKIFKLLTEHNIVIMGYNTFVSIGCLALKNRVNIVITSQFNYESLGQPADRRLYFQNSIDAAIALTKEKWPDRDVFFIGGKKILDDAISRTNLLNGIYHSKISDIWPKSDLTTDTASTETEVSSYYVRPDLMKNYRLVAQKIGMRDNLGETVRCSFWARSTIPQSDIVVDISVLGKYDAADGRFYRPSLHQTFAGDVAALEASKTSTDTITPEQIETIFTVTNKNAIEEAIKTPNVLERDRGMAVVDLEAYDKAVSEVTQSMGHLDKLFQVELAAKTQEEKSAPGGKDAAVAVCSDFVGVAKEIGELLVIKDAAYGSAFEKTKEIFKILFPAGLPVGAYDDALTIMRILDKICRLGVLCTNPEENKTAERTEDAWKDIAGYAIKALSSERKRSSEDMTNK